MDLKSDELLQGEGEGQTDIKGGLDDSKETEKVQIIDDHLANTSSSNGQTLLNTSEEIGDTPLEVATTEQTGAGDVYETEMKSNKDDKISHSETDAAIGGGDSLCFKNDQQSVASQTLETEPSIPNENKEEGEDTSNSQTVIKISKNQTVTENRSTATVSMQDASTQSEEVQSSFIDNTAVPEEIISETSNVVGDKSRSITPKAITSKEEKDNINSGIKSPDSGVQSANGSSDTVTKDTKSEECPVTEDTKSKECPVTKDTKSDECPVTEDTKFEECTVTEDTKSEECPVTKNTESPQNEDYKDVEEYLDVLGNGLLKMKVLKAGDGPQSRPDHGETVFLSTEGHLEDGTIIDKETVSFILGDGDVIKAWDLAVSLMEVGEQCELITDAKYAYGSLGKDTVPADANITYVLELIKKEPGLDLDLMSVEERTEKGEVKRERGNMLFVRKDFQEAINSYSIALKFLEHPASMHNVNPAALKRMMACQVKCYNNLAACQLKIEAFDAAIKSSNKVLSSEPDNVKALFRIGKSYGCKGDCESAEPYLRKALALDPLSKMLHRELAWVTRKMKLDNASQKAMYRRMMGNDDEVPPKKKISKWWRMPLLIGSVVAGTLAVIGAVYRTSQH